MKFRVLAAGAVAVHSRKGAAAPQSEAGAAGGAAGAGGAVALGAATGSSTWSMTWATPCTAQHSTACSA